MQAGMFHPAVAAWFEGSFREPTACQARAWDAIAAGQHTLIAAPTGSGKTLAGFLPSLIDLMAPRPVRRLHTLYISPLKALAVDVARNLETPAAEMGLPIRIEARTGDTPSDRKARQRAKPPHILLTTPESLALLSGGLVVGSAAGLTDKITVFPEGYRPRADTILACTNNVNNDVSLLVAKPNGDVFPAGTMPAAGSILYLPASYRAKVAETVATGV
jgi:hypothetical protein